MGTTALVITIATVSIGGSILTKISEHVDKKNNLKESERTKMIRVLRTTTVATLAVGCVARAIKAVSNL